MRNQQKRFSRLANYRFHIDHQSGIFESDQLNVLTSGRKRYDFKPILTDFFQTLSA